MKKFLLVPKSLRVLNRCREYATLDSDPWLVTRRETSVSNISNTKEIRAV